MSAFQAFTQTQQTFAEAEEKAKKEAGAPKVERFRVGEDGEYVVRVLPLAPNFDEEGNILPMERTGYEYAVHQQFLGIKTPSKKGKSKKINIPVIRTTDAEVGYSVDLIDTYVKIAKEMYSDDKELMELIGQGGYFGGLRWNFQHAIMVLDVSSNKERAKGPQLWQCSHSQYKEIDSAKLRLWKELKETDNQETCPICGLENAYPVKIIRSSENKRTSYSFDIGRKVLNITEEEAEKLLDLPRIPELIYRYTRYQYEATLAFLRQYDEEHDMEICKEPDFVEAAAKLAGELPADDTSHFDIAGASSKENGKEEVTIDSLYSEYDMIVDQDLGEKSDEYQELREKIRQFIEDKGLDVRISRTKNNLQLLEEIEQVMDSQSKKPVQKEKVETEEEKPVEKKRMPRPKVEEPEEDNEETVESESEPESESDVEEEKPVRTRTRRPRPTVEEEPEDEPEEADTAEENEPEEENEPARRPHVRRRR